MIKCESCSISTFTRLLAYLSPIIAFTFFHVGAAIGPGREKIQRVEYLDWENDRLINLFVIESRLNKSDK
jgi:hypothetical protein